MEAEKQSRNYARAAFIRGFPRSRFTNGHVRHAKPNGGGTRRLDVQAALDLLVEAIRTEALDDLRKKLGS